MRPALAVAVWVVILGGLWVYMQTRSLFAPPVEAAVELKPPPGIYTLEVTPTFDVSGGSDPFALQPVEDPPLVVLLNGQQIVEHEQLLSAGMPQRFTWDNSEIPIEADENEFRVRLPSIGGDPAATHGVRVRLLRDGREVADQTLWSEPGRPIDSVVRFFLSGTVPSEHED